MISEAKRLQARRNQIEFGLQIGCTFGQLKNFRTARICLQREQMKMSAAARSCDHEGGPTEILVGGARGGGKTFWCMAQLAADDCQRMPGLKVLFLRKLGKAARESIVDLRRQLLRNIPHKHVHNGIYFPNGSRIITGHFQHEKDIDAYLGLEYDVIAIEEATILTKSKYLMILSCCRTSKPGWRARMYATTNPGGVGHAFIKERFITPWRKGKETATRFIPSKVTDNRYARAEYIKILDGQVGWLKRAWRYGDWDIAAGQFFSQWSDDHHVVEEIDVKRARTWALSLDYGFTHYTVATLGFWDGDGDLWVVNQWCARKTLIDGNANGIKSMIERERITLSSMDYKVAGADIFAKESRAKSIAEDYEEKGIKFRPAVMDRINGAAELLRLMGDPLNEVKSRFHVHRRCSMLIECIPALQHDPNRPEDVLKVDCDEDGAGGDDTYDSVRYLAAQRYQPVIMKKLVG